MLENINIIYNYIIGNHLIGNHLIGNHLIGARIVVVVVEGVPLQNDLV